MLVIVSVRCNIGSDVFGLQDPELLEQENSVSQALDVVSKRLMEVVDGECRVVKCSARPSKAS